MKDPAGGMGDLAQETLTAQLIHERSTGVRGQAPIPTAAALLVAPWFESVDTWLQWVSACPSLAPVCSLLALVPLVESLPVTQHHIRLFGLWPEGWEGSFPHLTLR